MQRIVASLRSRPLAFASSSRSKLVGRFGLFPRPYLNGQVVAANFATSRAVDLKRLSESFNDGTSAVYVEQMYEAYKKDPKSVHVSWASYFKNVDSGLRPGEAYTPPPTLKEGSISTSAPTTSTSSTVAVPTSPAASENDLEKALQLTKLIRAYQVRGHLLANLDPLGLDQQKSTPPELELSFYNFTEADLDREFFVGHFRSFVNNQEKRTMRDIIHQLKQSYCGTIGFEYMHIQDRGRCDWLRERIEVPRNHLSSEDKLNLLDRLHFADLLEKFLAKKFPSAKRFGLDGCESLIPGIKSLIDSAAEQGVESVVIGMPHRGRINVLANVLRKPLDAVFSDFGVGTARTPEDGFMGDVKYHLGTSFDRPTRTGKKVHLSLLANPSHLEAVDTVVLGKARAKQHYLGDDEASRSKVLPLLMHGDAAFSGQGVVYETFDLAGLPYYTTGGTIHIIVNNQIGFTTDPKFGRSWVYCTEVAKSVEAPIFHVNGDDPEAVVFAFNLAAEWRQTFKTDAVVDVVCYRRFGHNEQDVPSFTQPRMYAQIAKHEATLSLYSKQLTEEKVISEQEVKQMYDRVYSILEQGYEAAKDHVPNKDDWLSSKWSGFKSRKQMARIKNTGSAGDIIQKVGKTITTVPEGFNLHPNLKRIMAARQKMIETGEHVDWAMAEALAFGTLLYEGNHVRLSGQDVERGTFSHRHAVLHDQKTFERYIPLQNVTPPNGNFIENNHFTVCNSSLSEFGVCGFEFGYSLENPNTLVLWEAQFGDFANGAQVIIDQFFACAEAKWKNQCGLVLLLPHGFEGQGPEHSSARIERFLQLHDSDYRVFPEMQSDLRRQIQESNFQVVNCTTPANYFHVLRRQIHREFRKPLVVFTPKSLLKHRSVVSTLSDMDDKDTHVRFLRVIPETDSEILQQPKEKIRKIVMCSGKVYYDLIEFRKANNIKDAVVVRIEQLAPFPFDHIRTHAQLYPNATFTWVQEEPMNMGPWFFVYHHIKTAVKSVRGTIEPEYAGRDPAASPATGLGAHVHNAEMERFLTAAFA